MPKAFAVEEGKGVRGVAEARVGMPRERGIRGSFRLPPRLPYPTTPQIAGRRCPLSRLLFLVVRKKRKFR